LSIVLDDEDEGLNMMVLVVAGAERRLESSADAGIPDCSGQASSISPAKRTVRKALDRCCAVLNGF
jgi:hypothetical protein